MKDNTKSLIKDILKKEDQIPRVFWWNVLWLQESPKLGIMRNERIIWEDEKGEQETNWQNFFRKVKIPINDREIQQRLSDYLLLMKGEELTAHDVIQCRNAQIRSHLLKKFGYEKLIEELGAIILHEEGTSQLIHIDLGKYIEAIRLVKVQDSTTDEFYLLRVPPDMKTCNQAIAWTFGLEEDEYDPVQET